MSLDGRLGLMLLREPHDADESVEEILKRIDRELLEQSRRDPRTKKGVSFGEESEPFEDGAASAYQEGFAFGYDGEVP